MLKRCLLFFCVLIWMGQSMAASEVIQELSERLQGIQTYQANFQHLSFDSKGDLLEDSQGQMTLKKKRQFRWQVNTPDKAMVMSDGKKIWNYDEDLEQVTIQAWSEQEKNSPAAFLTGELDGLEKDYEAIKENKSCLKSSEVCFELKAKNPENNFQKMWIGFSKGMIKEFHFVDPLGQKNIFLFSHIKNNIDLQDGLFTFKIPAGVDVIESL